MEIGSSQPGFSANSRINPGGSQGKTAISSDFETFIKMLTVQMENQDPLNPVEASDFAVQLATFSNVEQQVLTNNLLTDLAQQIGAQSIAQMAGWVGMEARAVMPVEFAGAPVTLSLKADSLAETAELVVRNAQGTEVSRQAIPAEDGTFDWAGTRDGGAPLPYGTYEISVDFYAADQLISNRAAEVHGVVVEARNDDGVPTLRMASGQTVPASDILGLSDPLL